MTNFAALWNDSAKRVRRPEEWSDGEKMLVVFLHNVRRRRAGRPDLCPDESARVLAKAYRRAAVPLDMRKLLQDIPTRCRL